MVMTRLLFLTALAFSLVLMKAPSIAANVDGEALVIDGKTLEVGGKRFRLFGIDAPDLGQTCRWPNKDIPCGKISKTALMDLVAQTRMACAPMAGPRDGIPLARCSADGFDIARNMVHTGWALAFRPQSTLYVDTENKAKAARRGLWKGEFTPPWVWRRGR